MTPGAGWQGRPRGRLPDLLREREKVSGVNVCVVTTWLRTKLARDEHGANLVEYILLVALIALAVIGAVVFLRGQMIDRFNYAGSTISNTPNP